MPIAWNDDPPGSGGRIVANCRALLARLSAEAPRRDQPTVATAREWHSAIYDGVPLPVPYYAGEVRDDDQRYPELIGYEVAVGPNTGVPAAEASEALADFERRAQRACGVLDELVPVDRLPADDRELHAVLALCAALHGEWVRIHPFANGNGRTARVWANWVAMRYALPPFVRLRPRPEGLAYAAAAHASMRGDHAPAIGVFRQQLTDLLGELR